MGSGVMPFARYVDSGNPLALGTDGVEAGSISMFETMKLTALLHTVTTSDYERWPSARQVLGMATRGGARSMGLEAELGALAPDMIADVILLDMKTVSFTPLNDVVNQVVYAENGSSVDTVIINGQVVMAERRLLTIDEQAIMDEIRSYMPQISAAYQAIKASGQKLLPTMDKIYRRASQDEPDNT
jgi:cytosine/adenosine deaminase-related metal-dependent hydrolase